jgi:hypothetical protein
VFSPIRRFVCFLAVVVALLGCSDDDSPPASDAGPRDTGPFPFESGGPDTGLVDAGPPDTNPVPDDTGPPDAPPMDSPPPMDAGPPGVDGGCVVDPTMSCDYYDESSADTQVDIHGAIRIALTSSAPNIVSATMILTVRDDAGTTTTVTLEAAVADTVLRADAGTMVPVSATSWTRLEIVIVDPCDTMPAPRTIYLFSSEPAEGIDAFCSAS